MCIFSKPDPGPKVEPLPPPPPPPEPKPVAKRLDPETQASRKRSVARTRAQAGTQSLIGPTGPQGIQTAANTNRKALLGA